MGTSLSSKKHWRNPNTQICNVIKIFVMLMLADKLSKEERWTPCVVLGNTLLACVMEGSPAVWLLLAMLISYSGLSEKKQLQIFCLVVLSPGLLFTPMNYLMLQQDTNLGNVDLTRELQRWIFPTCCHWAFFVAFYSCRTASIPGSYIPILLKSESINRHTSGRRCCPLK